MQNKFKLLFFILFSITSLVADGYRIELKKTLNSNAEDTLLPTLILPVSWNENLSSSLEYRSGESTDDRKVEGFEESIYNEIIQHSRIKLNAINYAIANDDFTYFFGLGASYETYEKTQKGHLVFNGNRSDFDNSIDINILSLYVKVQGMYKSTYLDTKLYALIIPISNLEVTQKAIFSGAIIKNLSASSSKAQNINYEVDLELTTKLDTFIDFNFNANYRFLPIDYTLDSLSGPIDTSIEEDIMLLSLRVLFNFEVLNGWMPTIGYSNERTNSKNTADGSVRKLEENIVYLGVNTRF